MSDEVNTESILQLALSSNKECFIPRYVGSTMEMLKLRSWDDYQTLPETSWKIKQPADDDNSRESALETGLLPGAVFIFKSFLSFADSDLTYCNFGGLNNWQMSNDK